jgi:hypothetical protein
MLPARTYLACTKLCGDAHLDINADWRKPPAGGGSCGGGHASQAQRSTARARLPGAGACRGIAVRAQAGRRARFFHFFAPGPHPPSFIAHSHRTVLASRRSCRAVDFCLCLRSCQFPAMPGGEAGCWQSRVELSIVTIYNTCR